MPSVVEDVSWIKGTHLQADTAADLLARASETEIADAIFSFGEERFSRRKHDAAFPSGAARFCLERAGVGLVFVVAAAAARDRERQRREHGRDLAHRRRRVAGPLRSSP